MKKTEWFPLMLEPPEGTRAAAATVAWGVLMISLPSLTNLAAIWFPDSYAFRGWLQVIYSLLFGLLMICIYGRYLADSVMNVQMDPKGFVITVAIASVVIVLVPVAFALLTPMDALFAVPVMEFRLWFEECATVMVHPVFGTVAAVLFSSVAVSCMYYPVGFALMCAHSPKWAYMIVSAVLLVPYLFRFLYHGQMQFEWETYLMRLPIHLVACWSYQKTDTIWAPIACHGVTNLLFCLAVLMMEAAGYLALA